MALTKNSKIVTGTGTYWLAAGLHPGDIFSVDCVTEYEVATIDSNTQITLKTPYTGDSTTEIAYRIIRNFTASMSAETAANAANLLNNFRRYVDLDMQSIHGKSAYQIACDKGYVGTESEWVASLKGDSAYQVAVANGYTGTASEWLESLHGDAERMSAIEAVTDTLDDRTNFLTLSTLAGLRNSIYRGKGLGSTFTEEQLATIRDHTFNDMYLGDFWSIPGVGQAMIAGFNYHGGFNISNNSGLLRGGLVLVTMTSTPITDPATDFAPGGAYTDTKWYTETRPDLITKLEEFFGADNIPSYWIPAPVSYEGKIPSAWSAPSSKVHMPTFSMITGHSPFHAKNPYNGWGLGNNNFYGQLPIIRNGYCNKFLATGVADMGANIIHNLSNIQGNGWGRNRGSMGTQAFAAYGVFFVGCSIYGYPL